MPCICVLCVWVRPSVCVCLCVCMRLHMNTLIECTVYHIYIQYEILLEVQTRFLIFTHEPGGVVNRRYSTHGYILVKFLTRQTRI